MAKSTPRGGRGQPARAAAKSKKAAAAEAGPTEETPGIGFDTGVIILGTIATLAALALVDKIQGMNGDGIFF